MGSCMLRISKEHNAATRFFFFAFFFSSPIRGRSVQVQPTNVIVLLYRVTHCIPSCRLRNLDLSIIIKQQLWRIPTLLCGSRTTTLMMMMISIRQVRIMIPISKADRNPALCCKKILILKVECTWGQKKNAKPSIFVLRFHLDLNKPFFSAQTDVCFTATRPFISHTKKRYSKSFKMFSKSH